MKAWLKANIDPDMLNVLAFFAGLGAIFGLGAIIAVALKIALYQWGGG